MSDFLAPGGAMRGALFTRLLRDRVVARELDPGDRVGPYRIERELGRGGMAVVYLAQRADGEFEQQVALKLVRSELAATTLTEELFRRERQLLATLDHPNIARLIDGGRTSDGALWFAMERVDGVRVDQHVAGRDLSLRERMRLFLQVCTAVGYAHQRLIVHRDLKPSNILVSDRGEAKLLDFGIAALSDVASVAPAAMTPGWASPEQRRGDVATTASDIYQLGLLLTHLIDVAGWRARASVEMTGTHVADEALAISAPRDPQIADRDLRAIVARATHDIPEQRYAAVAELVADVDAWLQRRPVRARNGGPFYRARRLVLRHPVATVGVVGAALALALLGWQAARERDVARFEAQRATTAAGAATRQAERAQAALGFLAGLLGKAQPGVHQGHVPTVEDLLSRGAEELAATPNAPVRAELLGVLGSIRIERGEFAEAGTLLEDAVPLLRRESSPRLLAEALGNLAYTLDYAQSERALAMFDEALALLADDASATELRLRFERYRASVLFGTGKFQPAADALQRTLAQDRALLGDAHAETATTQVWLAMALSDLDREDEAVALAESGYRTLERVLGADHPRVLQAGQTYATRLSNLGKHAEQEILLRELLPRVAKLWGEDQPRYARFLTWYAKSLTSLGRADEALPRLERAMTIYDARPPLDDLGSPNTLQSIGEAQLALGQRIEALATFRRMLVRADERVSAAPADDGSRVLKVVDVLLQLDRRDEAAQALPQAWERARRMREPTDRVFGSIALAEARLALGNSDPDRARACATNAQRILAPLSDDGERAQAKAILDAVAKQATGPSSISDGDCSPRPVVR